MQLTIKSNVGLVRQGLENLGAEVPQIGRRRIYNVLLKIKSALHKPGDAPTYPIQWDSEKQRRAFFATDGFGRGIPARRTGRYQSGWNIAKLDNGYVIANSTSYGKYIAGSAYGTGQSRIHQGRWPLFRDVVEAELETLPEQVADEIDLVARRVLPQVGA